MKKETTVSQLTLRVALGTILILLIPFVAMQFSTEVDWSVIDFIVMGALLFGTGLSFMLIIRSRANIIYRAAMGLAVGSTFFLIWANLAVGLIGSGPNLGNMLYILVVAVVIISSIRSGFSLSGMEGSMYLTAIVLVVVAAIQLSLNMDESVSSVTEILSVNAFFATLFGIAGALFHLAAKGQSPQQSEG